MIKIKIPAKLEALQNLYSQIYVELPPELLNIKNKIELVLEEILINIFSYAYKDSCNKAEAEVTFKVHQHQGSLCAYIGIRDWGAPFNPFLNAPTPDTKLAVSKRAVGGLGIHLVKSLVSHYSYTYEEKSNFIELYFTA